VTVLEFDGRVLNGLESPDDPRDFPAELDTAIELPERYLVTGLPPFLNQGNTGTCGGHAGAGLRQWQEKRAGHGVIAADPFALYDLCKVVDRQADPLRRLGTTARTVLRTLKGSGTPLRGGGRAGKIATYWRVPLSETAIKTALVTRGVLLVRCDWDAAWMRLPVNRVMRDPSGGRVGGHLFLLVGYDDRINGRSLVMRNSWGRWSIAGNGNAYFAFRHFLSHRPEVWASTDVDD